MKTCSKCNEQKLLTEFRLVNPKTNKYSVHCKECVRICSREHYKNNTETHKSRVIVNSKEYYKRNCENYKAYKGDLKCVECGESHIAVLDFHHEDPTIKDYAVSNMMRSFSWDTILKEIAKCKVLC